MKTRLAILTIFMIAALVVPASADAIWTGSVGNGLGGFIDNVYEFDWSGSGSGVAVGMGPFGNVDAILAAYISQTPFDFYYQSNLKGFNDIDGNDVDASGLNSTWEYTVVATIQEKVIYLSQPAPGYYSAWFQTIGGSFEIINDTDTSTFADVPTGTGYLEGTSVAYGYLVPGSITTFNKTGAEKGQGDASLPGIVTYANSDFLIPAELLFDFEFLSDLQYPPGNSTTTGFFNGYTVTASDLLLKVDGKSTFSVVPEPSTLLLLGAGLLGLAGFARKRF
jgi:hypothetical protein